MKNKVGLILFGIGFIGTMIFGSGLDSPGDAWKGCAIMIVICVLIAIIGYKTMNVEEVLQDGGFVRIHESKAVSERKARNRNQVWEAWIATKNNAL